MQVRLRNSVVGLVLPLFLAGCFGGGGPPVAKCSEGQKPKLFERTVKAAKKSDAKEKAKRTAHREKDKLKEKYGSNISFNDLVMECVTEEDKIKKDGTTQKGKVACTVKLPHCISKVKKKPT